MFTSQCLLWDQACWNLHCCSLTRGSVNHPSCKFYWNKNQWVGVQQYLVRNVRSTMHESQGCWPFDVEHKSDWPGLLVIILYIFLKWYITAEKWSQWEYYIAILAIIGKRMNKLTFNFQRLYDLRKDSRELLKKLASSIM